MRRSFAAVLLASLVSACAGRLDYRIEPGELLVGRFAAPPVGPVRVDVDDVVVRVAGKSARAPEGRAALEDALTDLTIGGGRFTDGRGAGAFRLDASSTIDARLRRRPVRTALEVVAAVVGGLGATMFIFSCSPCFERTVTVADKVAGWSGIWFMGAAVGWLIASPYVFPHRTEATVTVEATLVAPDGARVWKGTGKGVHEEKVAGRAAGVALRSAVADLEEPLDRKLLALAAPAVGVTTPTPAPATAPPRPPGAAPVPEPPVPTPDADLDDEEPPVAAKPAASPGAAPGAAPGDGLTAKLDAMSRDELTKLLRDLKTLHDEGILTDAEFAAHKKAILERLTK